jgi:membrane-bound serine protease (ClpP class)
MERPNMDIFFNPNIVYLLLVLGFFLAVLALFSPGTGLLEAGALLVLIAAGWGVYNNPRPINLWALIVLAIGVFPFLLAMRKSRDILFLAIAIVAFELGSVYLFVPEVWWKPAINPFLAGFTIITTSLFLWFAGLKAIEAERMRPVHDLRPLIGQVGEARTSIPAEGSVQVGGEQWSAWSDAHIPAGVAVRVLAREGLILKVEKAG